MCIYLYAISLVISGFDVRVNGVTTIEVTDNDGFQISTISALEFATRILSNNNGFFFKVNIDGTTDNTDIITSKVCRMKQQSYENVSIITIFSCFFFRPFKIGLWWKVPKY